MLPSPRLPATAKTLSFNGHPPLGVNATRAGMLHWTIPTLSFNGHPPLGVNATISQAPHVSVDEFQWAPTLGGECYCGTAPAARHCYAYSFNGHPPLGVNATVEEPVSQVQAVCTFQWAPTLGGECYGIVYLITPPLCQGVDALLNNSTRF